MSRSDTAGTAETLPLKDTGYVLKKLDWIPPRASGPTACGIFGPMPSASS